METNSEFHKDSPPRLEKKLYKSRTDRYIEGVCGGIGHYFNINPLWIRIVWVVLTIYSGVFPGLIAYVLASVIIPVNPNEQVEDGFGASQMANIRHLSNAFVIIIGSVLILVGVFYLLYNFNLIPWEFINLARLFVRQALFPIILIVLGLLLIVRRSRK